MQFKFVRVMKVKTAYNSPLLVKKKLLLYYLLVTYWLSFATTIYDNISIDIFKMSRLNKIRLPIIRIFHKSNVLEKLF